MGNLVGPNGEQLHPKLGRLPSWDDQNEKFLVKRPEKLTLRDRAWSLSLRLDQGNTAACTGNARIYDLAASPVPLKRSDGKAFTENDAQAMYRLAQKFDEWPGEDYDGSSVLGALKAAKNLGYIGEYRWATNIDDLIWAVGNVGPVVMGTDWLEPMFEPNEDGLLDVSGSSAGGHSYIVNAVNMSGRATVAPRTLAKVANEPVLRITNSWGTTWGYRGTALITRSGLADLLNNGGEAAITTVALHR